MKNSYKSNFSNNPLKTEITSRMSAMGMNLKKLSGLIHMPPSDVQRMIDLKSPSDELLAGLERVLGGPISMWKDLIPKTTSSFSRNLFYDEVRRVLKEKRFTIADISKKLGVTPSTVYNMLSFHNSYPTKSLLLVLSEFSYDESLNYDYWATIVEKVGKKKPKDDTIPEPEENVHETTYFLMENNSVISVVGDYLVASEGQNGSQILLTLNSDGSYTKKGAFIKQSRNRIGLGLYDGKLLVKLKDHQTLFAVLKYEEKSNLLTVDTLTGDMTASSGAIEKIYEAETFKEIFL